MIFMCISQCLRKVAPRKGHNTAGILASTGIIIGGRGICCLWQYTGGVAHNIGLDPSTWQHFLIPLLAITPCYGLRSPTRKHITAPIYYSISLSRCMRILTCILTYCVKRITHCNGIRIPLDASKLRGTS